MILIRFTSAKNFYISSWITSLIRKFAFTGTVLGVYVSLTVHGLG